MLSENVLTLADRAYQDLEELIVTLKLKPGSAINETELCTLLNLGRTPVREAILRLSHDKLINIFPRKGTFVSEIQIDEHLNLLETRRVLDELITRQAVQRANPEHLNQLEDIALRMKKAADSEAVDEFMKLDKEFDIVLMNASKNKYAFNAVLPMHIHCRRFWYYYKKNNDLRTPASRHVEIMKQVCAGDELKAAEASNLLLDYLIEFTKKAIF